MANFQELSLGCIDADFCNEMLVFVGIRILFEKEIGKKGTGKALDEIYHIYMRPLHLLIPILCTSDLKNSSQILIISSHFFKKNRQKLTVFVAILAEA